MEEEIKKISICLPKKIVQIVQFTEDSKSIFYIDEMEKDEIELVEKFIKMVEKYK